MLLWHLCDGVIVISTLLIIIIIMFTYVNVCSVVFYLCISLYDTHTVVCELVVNVKCSKSNVSIFQQQMKVMKNTSHRRLSR